MVIRIITDDGVTVRYRTLKRGDKKKKKKSTNFLYSVKCCVARKAYIIISRDNNHNNNNNLTRIYKIVTVFFKYNFRLQ